MQRVIQEYVPGKQITLAHIIASPQHSLYKKLGINEDKQIALGILTITPSEAAIIAADIATKSAAVEIGFLDRFSGSLVITGDVSDIEAAMKTIVEQFEGLLSFSTANITKS
ncbi:BMC domain-containing protein [Lutispora sp.]|jgi:ethanolamine utilization protein EutS|uniref:BMC domain-containing protein n=1 Tax=Lutispora sp. TaxID=2828727 RepID=UPI003568DBAA